MSASSASSPPVDWDVIVVGAGAAGLMAAIAAGRRGRRVLVLDHANKVGKKILMSGGGHCNFTNTGTTPAQYLSANPHFCKSALARYTPQDFIDLVDAHGIAWHEKELGQLFCDGSSKQIVQLLLDEADGAGVQVRTHCAVQPPRRVDDGFVLDTAIGRLRCASLIVATGGLSIPSMGATGFGYDIARQFGHALLPTRAGLVPLTLSGKHQERLDALSGVALDVEAGCNGVEASIILLAAMLAFPATWRARLVGILIGLLSIHAVNILRIVSLFYIGQWNMTAFDWAHLYIWQALIMLDVFVVFLLWLRYVLKSGKATAAVFGGAA